MATDTGDRTFTIPEAPAIPGLRFRHYRGPADHPAMLDVRNAAHLAGGLNDPATLEGMDVWYAGLTNSDPEEDLVLVELGGRLVAYGRTWWADRTSGERAFEAYCFIDTNARGRGLGTALLALTSREYDLLVFLLSHPRQAFSREQLLDRVWNWSFGDTSTVTVHVRRLREKIERNPTLPERIVTVWGVGYRYEPVED